MFDDTAEPDGFSASTLLEISELPIEADLLGQATTSRALLSTPLVRGYHLKLCKAMHRADKLNSHKTRQRTRAGACNEAERVRDTMYTRNVVTLIMQVIHASYPHLYACLYIQCTAEYGRAPYAIASSTEISHLASSRSRAISGMRQAHPCRRPFAAMRARTGARLPPPYAG